jgi:hypothetical protein
MYLLYIYYLIRDTNLTQNNLEDDKKIFWIVFNNVILERF